MYAIWRNFRQRLQLHLQPLTKILSIYIPISIIRKWRLRNVRNVICKYESCLVCNEQGTLLDEMCPRLPIHRYKFIGPWEIWIKFEINIFQANHSDWWLKYLLWSCPQEWDECHWNVLMISQHRFRWWLGDVRQQAITWANVDRDFFSYDVTRSQWVKTAVVLIGKRNHWRRSLKRGAWPLISK